MRKFVVVLVVVFGLVAGIFAFPAVAAGTFPIIREEVSTGRWFVFCDPATQEGCRGVFRQIGVTVVHDLWLINALSVEATEEQAELLRLLGYQVVPVGAHELAASPLGAGPELQILGVDKLHRKGIKGSGVKVAILDSGIITSTKVNPTIIYQKDWVENDDLAQDDAQGHGTAMTSIIWETAPEASFIIEKICQNNLCADDKIIAGLQDGLVQGADVLNLSIGGENLSAPLEINPVNMALEATGRQAVIVIAAGNRQLPIGIGMTPSVITVGASNTWGNALGISFTDRGRYHDKIIKPDLVAPGIAVMATSSDGAAYRYSGTSISAAFVSGSAVLLRQQFPNLAPNEYKALLQNSGTAIVAVPNLLLEGTGFPHLNKAIDAQLIVTPGIIHFGWHTDLGTYGAGRPLVVKNISAQIVTGTVNLASSVPGLTIEVSPSSFVVAPGESLALEFTLTAAEGLNYPLSDPFMYNGDIIIETAGQKVRIPWVLIRAHRVEVEYAAPHSVLLLETGESFTTMAPTIEVFAVTPAVKDLTVLSVLIKPQGLTATMVQVPNNEPVKRVKIDAAQFNLTFP